MFLNNQFNYITGLYIFIHVKMSNGKDLKIFHLKVNPQLQNNKQASHAILAYPE